ncbi:hypothetical protein DRJ04_09310, partial [Candidatus Aerophobetes bacterium]
MLQNFSSVNGYYNESIHKRLYDFEIEAYDTIARIYDVDTFSLQNDFIKIDPIAPAETNLVNSVNGIAFNASLTNRAKIKIYYSQDVLVNYGLSEDYLKIFVCYDWLWTERSCSSSDLWQEIAEYRIDKLHNFVEANTTSFSSNSTGYAAYVIAERKPPSYAELTVYDISPVDANHGQNASIAITIKSTGTSDVFNAKMDCISGTVCQTFNASYLRYIGTLVSGEERTVTINISVPLGYSPGSYYGVVRFSADNINPIDKNLQVNVIENRSWVIDKHAIAKTVGRGYGEVEEIEISSLANVPLDFNITYSSLLSGASNLTLQKLSTTTLQIYYNTSLSEPGNYSENVTIESTGSDPEERVVNISLEVVNLTLSLVEPKEETWVEINQSLKLSLRVLFENTTINSTQNISLRVFLNEIEAEIESLTFNSSTQAFDITMQVPVTSVENTLKIECSLLPCNYSAQVIKAGLIFVNDTVLPTIQETQEFLLENRTLLMLKASDNDVINSTIANVTYPNGTSVEVNLTFNSSTGYFESYIETLPEGDYKVEYLVADASNNTNTKTEWFRVSPLIYLSGNLNLTLGISFYKPVIGYKFKEFTVNGSYNESLRAGDYDIDLNLEGVSLKIFNSSINESLPQPVCLDKPPISIFTLPLTKNRFDSLAYAFAFNLSRIRVYFDFSSYVDRIVSMNDLRIYKCENYSLEERECYANFTTLVPSVDHVLLKASIELNESDPVLIFAEEVVCGNGVCESSYGETYQNCPQDCPQTAVCGNGVCEIGESPFNCPEDCGTCGNGVCDSGETYQNCPQDCPAPTTSTVSAPTYSVEVQEINYTKIMEEVQKALNATQEKTIELSEKQLDINIY